MKTSNRLFINVMHYSNGASVEIGTGGIVGGFIDGDTLTVASSRSRKAKTVLLEAARSLRAAAERLEYLAHQPDPHDEKTQARVNRMSLKACKFGNGARRFREEG